MFKLFSNRRTGILLHPTSLPGSYDQGKLNNEAFNFIDFLYSSSVTIWQILPLGPTHEDASPYQSYSSFALNPKLLDLSMLRRWDCLPKDKIDACLNSCSPLNSTYKTFIHESSQKNHALFTAFKTSNQYWLDDYALFRVLKNQHDEKPWYEWPSELRDRELNTLKKISKKKEVEVDEFKFEQFVLFNSWHQIKEYATLKHIAIFGDIPLFVSHDSADVWANRSLFDLDEEGMLITVAGVPPDYFCATGQRWGNPHYLWDEMAKDDYSWWIQRLSYHFILYDMVRIDHFRGLESSWKIPAEEKTALKGEWKKAPGAQLLTAFEKHFQSLPIVAEDLGIITPEVEALRVHFKLPGMKILQFAFNGDTKNPYLPHNHTPQSVIYTGTHDNDTTLGWYQGLENNKQKHCLKYLNYPEKAMPWPLIQAALASVAQIAIIPMQDIMSLGSEHRMNIPGTTNENWKWRFQWNDTPKSISDDFKSLNKIYGRDIDSWSDSEIS